ncbi:hypothetical protein pipiens_001378 [Culex pipiens pipiens]|uniref:Uncharacterized protein n=1 Tax=Culex pipiens pipiens TaxID=38569 RepID=A0ABD1CZ66_CULPP
MENSGKMYLTELIGRSKQLLDGIAAEQNLTLLESGRRINTISQVVSLLADITGRINEVVLDQPPAAIPPPVVSPTKMKLGKNKPMPKPLTLKSELEPESSSSEDEAAPSKNTTNEGKSPGAVGGSGKDILCRSCKKPFHHTMA